MPLHHYGVLKGRPIGAQPEFEEDSPHYQVHMLADNTHYRIAINVKSNSDTNSELQYLVNNDFHHPITQQLLNLSTGFSNIKSQFGGMALDFIRGNFFNIDEMRTLPFNLPGPNNDLNELVNDQIQRAIKDAGAMIYAFGERWGPETNKRDKVFGFLPGNGVHDIHMNQGNDSAHRGDDGVWQDGGLLIHFPTANRWVGIFLKFQSQTSHTEEGTGHRIEPTTTPIPGEVTHPDHSGEPDKVIRIVAAMINPFGGEPELETVTLLNASPEPINLNGWSIVDRIKRKQMLSGTIGAGDTLKVKLSKDVKMGNKGGLITLLNAQELKVDGISYTQEQAAHEGWTVVF